MKSFNLKDALAGEPVKLNNGYKAYIEAYIMWKFGGNKPALIGYYLDIWGKQKQMFWNEEGACIGGRYDFAIKKMWKDEPPIIKVNGKLTYRNVMYFGHKFMVPSWVKCIATDKEGRIFGYRECDLIKTNDHWRSINFSEHIFLGVAEIGSLDWRDSLVEVNNAAIEVEE